MARGGGGICAFALPPEMRGRLLRLLWVGTTRRLLLPLLLRVPPPLLASRMLPESRSASLKLPMSLLPLMLLLASVQGCAAAPKGSLLGRSLAGDC